MEEHWQTMGRYPRRILQTPWFKASCKFLECSLYQALRKYCCKWIQRCKQLFHYCHAAPLHLFTDVLIVTQENHASIFETYPDQKFLKTFAKADVQEVALTKAVSEAKIKLAPALWKEVVVQMKAFTGETFAAPSLRKRYEEIEKRQFYLSEQNPAKDNQWPPLPTSKNHHTAYFDFDDTPELLPVAVGDLNIADHDHGQNRRIRDMSSDTDSTDGNTDYVEHFRNGKAKKSSAAISDRKVKFEDMLRSRQEIEKENASPSHTHPSAVYSKIQHPVEASYDGFNNNMGVSTPTPASAVGVALKGTGVGAKTSAGPRLGLVGYEDSDDSD